ncbi:HD domain protein [compost metagenome]
MKFPHSLRDPIHGMVPMTACEWELLRTRALSRLRGIRQMGMAYVVFPGAHHTRFEHVIGAMHTAGLLAERLGFDDSELRLIRLAALFHDIGHRPFSHSLEDAARRHVDRPELSFLHQFLDHEQRTRELVCNDPEIGEVLARHPGYRELDREELALAAIGEHSRPEFNFFTHSEIDADRIDYVLRDNYYCGFAPGVDIQALRELYVPDPTYGIVLNSERLYVAQQILFARFHLISHVQNNPFSRLGDLILAECIRDALLTADDSGRHEFTRIVNEGQDADLEYFLRLHAPASWAKLQGLVSGTSTVEERYAYDFRVLSPVARYGIQSLRLEGLSVAQQLQERIGKDIEGGAMIDITRVKAPTDPIPTTPTGLVPWHGKLTEFPTIQGIIAASHDGAALHVYGPPGLRVGDEAFEHWVSRYKLLDPSMDPAKAEGMLAELWGGDKTQMGLLLAMEEATYDLLAEQIRHMPSRMDVLFLVCYLTLGLLEQVLGEERLYLDGTEAVWAIIRHPSVVSAFGDRYPKAFETSEPSGTFAGDLGYLQRCGLLYVMTRLERVRNAFVERPKYGGTGWGRRLARLLAEPADSEKLARIDQAIRDLILPHQEVYREYFGLLGASGGAARRRELRRLMPVAITR